MESSWIETYGLPAVFVGALIEGEAVFIAAGYALSQGYLPMGPTVGLAVVGATLGDHFCFVMGRVWGDRLVQRYGWMRPVRARATRLMRRWGPAAAFATRFAYGLRAVLPLTIGASRFPATTFTPFNILGSLAFAGLYLSLGYFFGEAVEEFLGRTSKVQIYILLGILSLGTVLWVVREWRVFHSEAAPEELDPEDPGPEAGHESRRPAERR